MSHSLGVSPYGITSASNTEHIITHNRRTLSPIVSIVNTDTGNVITADEIETVDQNTIRITFPVPVAIRVRVV